MPGNHLRDSKRRAARESELPRGTSRGGQDTAILVREALAQLSPSDREVFLLRESGGLTYAEIAGTCGTTADAVRARLQRARQALRVLLAGTLASERARGIRFSGRNDV